MELFVVDYLETADAFNHQWSFMIIVANNEEEAREVFMKVEGCDERIEFRKISRYSLVGLIEQLKDATSPSYLQIGSCKLVTLASVLKEREEREIARRNREIEDRIKYPGNFESFGRLDD